jgi:2-polyprenyl-3-methyl-5-hydroxy-6-metoxy-1,4-benzoquinol methylase
VRETLPAKDTLKDFYEKKHESEYGSEAVYLNLDLMHYHQKILEIVKTGQTILDVGCATGYLGVAIKKKGNKVYGIEISEKAAKKAKEDLDDVIVGNIEEIEIPYPKKYFDLIICSDILEHLISPEQVLVKLAKYLKLNGVLLVVVPNVAHFSLRWMLLRGKWKYTRTGSMDYGHIRFFTKKSMTKLLERSGYKTKYIIPWIDLPFPLRILDRVLYRLFSNICSKFFDTILAKCFLFVAE